MDEWCARGKKKLQERCRRSSVTKLLMEIEELLDNSLHIRDFMRRSPTVCINASTIIVSTYLRSGSVTLHNSIKPRERHVSHGLTHRRWEY